jgi:heptosyltransferase-3
VKWGPWPIARDRQTSPIWLRHSQEPQRNSNITLIQGKQSCIPCAEEGCERHINSESECLTTLKSDNVIQEMDKFLASKSI